MPCWVFLGTPCRFFVGLLGIVLSLSVESGQGHLGLLTTSNVKRLSLLFLQGPLHHDRAHGLRTEGATWLAAEPPGGFHSKLHGTFPNGAQSR